MQSPVGPQWTLCSGMAWSSLAVALCNNSNLQISIRFIWPIVSIQRHDAREVLGLDKISSVDADELHDECAHRLFE